MLQQYLLLNYFYKHCYTIAQWLEISLKVIQNVLSESYKLSLFFKDSISVSKAFRSFTFITLMVEIVSSLGF